MTNHEFHSNSSNHIVRDGALIMSAFLMKEFADTAIDYRRRSDKASTIIKGIDRPGDHVVVVVSGFHTQAQVIANNFDRHVEDLGPAIYLTHPERGFSSDSSKEEVVKALGQVGSRQILWYAQSMGSLLTCDILSDPGVEASIGDDIEAVEFDSPYTGLASLPAVTQAAVHLARFVPPTKSVGRLVNTLFVRGTGKDLDFGEGVSQEEYEEHLMSSAMTPFGAIRGQAKYMRKNDVRNMDLSSIGSRIKRKTIISAASDNVLRDVFEDGRVINDAFGGGFNHLVASQRKANSHATGFEHPKSTVDGLLGRNRDQYRVISLGEQRRDDIREHLAGHALQLGGFRELVPAR